MLEQLPHRLSDGAALGFGLRGWTTASLFQGALPRRADQATASVRGATDEQENTPPQDDR